MNIPCDHHSYITRHVDDYFLCIYIIITTNLTRVSLMKSLKDKKGRNVLFNDAINTFYLRVYGVGHMVKDHSDSQRGNPLPPHGLLFPISSKGYFRCIIPQTG